MMPVMESVMTLPIDLSDVPTVEFDQLDLPMRLLIEAECALVLIRGATAVEKRTLEAQFWNTFEGTSEQGVAVLLRFWALVDTFQSRRFKAMFLNRGYDLIGAAVASAAKLRLNSEWGFNPQRLMWAMEQVMELTGTQEMNVKIRPSRRGVISSQDQAAA